jgi:hypothetical protein
VSQISTLPPGEYMRRLLRARAFLVSALGTAAKTAAQAERDAIQARTELTNLDRQIAALNTGPKGVA